MDKDKAHMNKQLENKGWEKMENILDKEMPVKKKDRRFMFMFLFLGLALVSFIAFKSILTEDKRTTPVVDIPIASLQVNSIESGQENVTQKVEETTTSENVKEDFSKKLEPQIIAQNNVETKHSIAVDTNNSKIVQTNFLVKNTPNSKQVGFEDLHNKINTDVVSSNFKDVLAKEVRLNPTNEPILPFGSLSQNTYVVNFENNRHLDIAPVFQNIELIKVEPIKQKLKLSPYLGLVSSISTNRNLYGYGLSAGLDIPISNKLYVHTGLSFQKINAKNYTPSYAVYEDANADFPEGLGMTEENEDSEENPTALGGAKTIDLLNLSHSAIISTMGLGYQVSNKLKFWTGISWRYVSSPQESTGIYSSIGSPNFNVAQSGYEFNSNSFNPTLGLQFEIANNLHTSLLYEYGTKPLYNAVSEDEDFKGNQYLHLTVGYNF